jgi:hypothetical protein
MSVIWFIALILLVLGIVMVVRGDLALGIVLILLAVLLGPGGLLFSRL